MPTLPLLPPAAMPGRAAGGAGGRAELGAGLARVGGLEDFAAAARSGVVAGRSARASRGPGDRVGIPGRAFRRDGVCGLLRRRDSWTPLPDLESELRSPRTPQGGGNGGAAAARRRPAARGAHRASFIALAGKFADSPYCLRSPLASGLHYLESESRKSAGGKSHAKVFNLSEQHSIGCPATPR